MRERLHVIVSTMRSGSSLFGHLLAEAGRIWYAGETHTRLGGEKGVRTAIQKIQEQGQGSCSDAPPCDKVLGHGHLPDNGDFIAKRADRIYLLLRHPIAIWRSQKNTGWETCSLKYLADQLYLMRCLAESVSAEKMTVVSYYDLTNEESRSRFFGEPVDRYTLNSKTGQAGWGDPGQLIRSGAIRECTLVQDVERALPEVWVDLGDQDFARAMAEFREILRLTGRDELNIDWSEADFFTAETLQIGGGIPGAGVAEISMADLGKLSDLPCEEGAFSHLRSAELIHCCEPEELLKNLSGLRKLLSEQGTIQFSTIDLDFVARLSLGEEPEYAQWYWEFFLQEGDEACSPAVVTKHFTRNWGRRFFYNRESLRRLLERAGFEEVREVSETNSKLMPQELYLKERFVLEGKVGSPIESDIRNSPMENSILPVVVIPIHSPNLKGSELFALRQIGKVLNEWDLFLLCPESVDVKSYLEVIPKLEVMRMHDRHFESVLGYNRLRKNIDLYETFGMYTHILFHELDAFVFKDNLSFWCKQGVDYIGAPWVYHTDDYGSLLYKGVGNSGFSLIDVKNTIKALKKLGVLAGETTFEQRASLMKLSVDHVHVQSELNVDVFFAFLAESDLGFKAASFNQAVKFGFELCPEALFELNQKELPFGCHAWNKYERDFWIPIMNSFGLGQTVMPPRVACRKPMTAGAKIAHLSGERVVEFKQNMKLFPPS